MSESHDFFIVSIVDPLNAVCAAVNCGKPAAYFCCWQYTYAKGEWRKGKHVRIERSALGHRSFCSEHGTEFAIKHELPGRP